MMGSKFESPTAVAARKDESYTLKNSSVKRSEKLYLVVINA